LPNETVVRVYGETLIIQVLWTSTNPVARFKV
jgi:hypothetical protein